MHGNTLYIKAIFPDNLRRLAAVGSFFLRLLHDIVGRILQAPAAHC